MNWPGECAAVIPCYNEDASIAAVVQGVHKHILKILVVDDGSTDDTASIAQQNGAQVLHHESNRGKGAALNNGFQTILKQGFTWAIMLDGDGQHSPADIPAFWKCAENTNAALVIGNRMCHPESMPWLRRRVNQWMSRRLSRRTGVALPDSQCGFRLVHLPDWSNWSLQTEHFEVESEMLVACIQAGKRVEFVPIQVISKPHTSKIHPLQDTLRWFRWWRARSSPH